MISDSLMGWEEEIDFPQRLDSHVLDQEAQFGDDDPLLVVCIASVNSASLAWPKLHPRCCC